MIILEAAIEGPCAKETNTEQIAITIPQNLNISCTNLVIKRNCNKIYLRLKSYSSNYSQRQNLIRF